MRVFLSVFLICEFLFLVQCRENAEIFVPTNEWQVVRDGQKIPKGLHVRINLETGLKEAKLLDDDPKATALTEVEGDKTVDNSASVDSIRKLQDETFDPDYVKKVKDQFRTYDEIKKNLRDAELTPKLDAEILAESLQLHAELKAKQLPDPSSLLVVLEDLDYMVHQYDNALEFIRLNGFRDVIYNINTSTPVPVKVQTLRLMASLLQNNVKPKIRALETGAVGVLLRLINTDPDKDVKNQAFAALGALLRTFPAAQRQFIETSGLALLADVFTTDNLKLQVRLVTLVLDLVEEHKAAREDRNLQGFYKDFNLVPRVLSYGWCEHLNKLLVGLVITDKDDVDGIEKCLLAMHSLREECGTVYNVALLTSLRDQYQNNKADEESFFVTLKDLCDDILYDLGRRKTEL